MYRILVLTDHKRHTAANSLYGLCRMIARDALVSSVDVVTRSLEVNTPFFEQPDATKFYATPVTEQFVFSEESHVFSLMNESDISSYDIVLLRLPPPIAPSFLNKLSKLVPESRIINSPTGIALTGTKSFLLEVEQLCAPIRLLNDLDDLSAMCLEMPVVLKPLNNYGGTGIVKIINQVVSQGDFKPQSWETFTRSLSKDFFPILGMKFLKNVTGGDKRNVVVNGHIIGSTIRYPKEGGWLCNVAQGGRSELAVPDSSELRIAKVLSEHLKNAGIIIYGFDTLEDDNGERVLSEINTTSVGGIVHMERDDSEDVLRTAVQHLMDYIDLEVYG